jgi:hypothetical protein
MTDQCRPCWCIEPAHGAVLDVDGRRKTYMNETRNETSRLAVAYAERQVQSARPSASWAASQASRKPLVQPAERQRVELAR